MTAALPYGGGRPVRRMARIGRARHPLARSLRALELRDHLAATPERLHEEVTEGLGRAEFFLVYQPRFSMATDEATEVEALLRWEGEAGALLGPRAFIPAVEQTPAMIPLGRWVVEEACTQAGRWDTARPAGVPPLTLAVNVTVREVLEPSFRTTLCGALDRVGLQSTQLQVELDAADWLSGDPGLPSRLGSLRGTGVRVAIDNVGPAFGLGAEHLDVDAVHIDRRWVRALGGGDSRLLRGLARLVTRAHASRAVVCATGVQSDRELGLLRDLHCDLVQGFHLCPPLPAEELDWIDDDHG